VPIAENLKGIFENLNISYFAEHVDHFIQAISSAQSDDFLSSSEGERLTHSLFNVFPSVIRAHTKWMDIRRADIDLLKGFTEQEFAEVSLLNNPNQRNQYYQNQYGTVMGSVTDINQLAPGDTRVYEKALDQIREMSNKIKDVHLNLKEFWKQLEKKALEEFIDQAPDLFFPNIRKVRKIERHGK
jgi:hypothetical protein